MSNKSDGSSELDNLLKTLSSRLGAKPEELKSAAQKGNINNIVKGLSPSDAEKIQKVLSDKEASKKILSSPQAQKLLKRFLGEK